MTIEVFLERVSDVDPSVTRCSICKEQFHTSPIGPRKQVTEFVEHVRKAIFESLSSERQAEIVKKMEKEAADDVLADLPENTLRRSCREM